MILGLAAHYQTSILKCPTGVYSLVGTIPQYMDRLCFETEAIAELALAEALTALDAGHADPNGVFYAIETSTPKERRPGSFHIKKVIITETMLELA